jgi:hypothetical protein
MAKREDLRAAHALRVGDAGRIFEPRSLVNWKCPSAELSGFLPVPSAREPPPRRWLGRAGMGLRSRTVGVWIGAGSESAEPFKVDAERLSDCVKPMIVRPGVLGMKRRVSRFAASLRITCAAARSSGVECRRCRPDVKPHPFVSSE